MSDFNKEYLKVVTVGHVDHGKSTITGRLLADTGSLPEGKLEQVKENCRRNAKPFEYAFLLDALKNEQSQGITIDMARCFFKTEKRNYIIIDAPGHIEFLKNMVTGAARADAALLVIDAAEGIQENSKRHGYMLAMLGVRQSAVIVNKIDLKNYSREVYESIKKEYSDFLAQIGVRNVNFIPASGRFGDNIVVCSEKMPWYEGYTVLEQIEAFSKDSGIENKPFRMPVQDIYKFTESGDERRIVAGSIVSGKISRGDEVVFLPSGKSGTVKTIEEFNSPERIEIDATRAAGFTLEKQIYIKPGELMYKKSETAPGCGKTFKVNIFWMGRKPMVRNRKYTVRLGAARLSAELREVINILDASELVSVSGKEQVDRHDIGLCVLDFSRPAAFDLPSEIGATGRFVIIDNYEIAGGGVIVENLDHGQSTETSNYKFAWESGSVSREDRARKNRHKGKFILISGDAGDAGKIASVLEKSLFDKGLNSYYLGASHILRESRSANTGISSDLRDEKIQRLCVFASALAVAELIFIS